MNKLELVRSLSREAGINFTGPSTTLNQIGEYGRCVRWIDDAWNEIELEHTWRWQWEQTTVQVLAGEHTAANSIPATRWMIDYTFNGTSRMEYAPWEEFSLLYQDVEIVEGEPRVWTIKPDGTFAINANVSANTDFTVQRFRAPTTLEDDVSEPAMPSSYHMAIVWLAMLRYCNFEEAGASRATTQAEYERIHSKLVQDQMMSMYSLGDALA